MQSDIKDQVYRTLCYFLQQDDFDIQANTLKAIGSVCIRHYEFMLEEELKLFYHRMLMSEDVPLKMRTEVLINIEMYLIEEEKRMIQQDLECKYLLLSVCVVCECFSRGEKFQKGEFEGNGGRVFGNG